MISGAFKVYPRDVDEVLPSYLKIIEARVMGVPDVYSGQRIRAFVVLKP